MDPVFIGLFCLAIAIPILVFLASALNLASGAPAGWRRAGLLVSALATMLWVVVAGVSLLPSEMGADPGIALLPVAGATVVFGTIVYAVVRFSLRLWWPDGIAFLFAAALTTLIADRFLLPIF